MIGRSRRGIRRASMRVRLAVAAAVLVGGGAAGVVAVAASHGNAVSAQSAGYFTRYDRGLSESHAMSDAMDWWSRSPQTSLTLISRMTRITTFSQTQFHTHTIAVQRGAVLAALPNEFVIESANHMFQVWHVNHGTKFLNVAGNPAGMSAMTGGTMQMPGNTNWNMKATALSRGDLVFVFGQKVRDTLFAQLVLFVSPLNVSQALAPYASSWSGTINGMNMAVNGTNVMINGTNMTQSQTTINGQQASFGNHT